MTPSEPCAGRPGVHFTPRRGWINDPHGLTLRDGRYHVFFQAVPHATVWEPTLSWGHASSADLLTWRQEPTALTPGEGDDGCWSGSVCTAPAGSEAAMFYTSVQSANLDRGVVRLARPADDGWVGWRKGPPLLTPPAEPAVTVFRDPNVFWDGDCWRMLVGAGYPDGRAAVLCYRSVDQQEWTLEGPLVESALPRPGGARAKAWECPQLIRVGDRHALVVSLTADDVPLDVRVALGTYREGRLQVDNWALLNHGRGHYAPTTFLDGDGEPCIIFWIRGIADEAAGWSGALSVPYRLSVVADRLTLTPHPALAAGRPDPATTVGFTWRPDADGSRFGLDSPDGHRVVDLAVRGDRLVISTPDDEAGMPIAAGDIHVLVDGPLVEIATQQAVVGLPVRSRVDPDPVRADGSLTRWWP